jgi:hypothetical protein
MRGSLAKHEGKERAWDMAVIDVSLKFERFDGHRRMILEDFE